MYRAVREYRLLPGSGEEFFRRVKQDFVPLIGLIQGFVSYEVRPAGNDQVTTISTFDTRSAAEESIFHALWWVQDNCADLIQELPRLSVDQLPSTHPSLPAPHAQLSHEEKLLVLDLTFEVLHPSTLGDQASTDPHIRAMVTTITQLLTQMRADPGRRDKVIYRFEGDVLPEIVATNLFKADHIILIKRGCQFVGYAEINWETNPWMKRGRYEGDILIDPDAYHLNEEKHLIEKGIGELGLLEMRRQGKLIGAKAIELDVYQRNQPMQHFLNHLMATHRLPISKRDMICGGPFDYTYLLSCEDAS